MKSLTNALNHIKMKSYMVGLAISQFFWKTHYNMFKHLQFFINNSKLSQNYLEIGPGHGLFAYYAFKNLKNLKNFHVIDISKTSLDMTKKIISYFNLDKYNISYLNDDMLNISIDERFDFITMGEVLEHVNFPQKLLLKLNSLLSKKGSAFISTCVNCPTIDHVYHFRSISEIQDMINKSKFDIVSEKILPVENLPMDEIIKKKITINYSAIIRKK